MPDNERPTFVVVKDRHDHGCIITLLLLIIAWPLAILYWLLRMVKWLLLLPLRPFRRNRP